MFSSAPSHPDPYDLLNLALLSVNKLALEMVTPLSEYQWMLFAASFLMFNFSMRTVRGRAIFSLLAGYLCRGEIGKCFFDNHCHRGQRHTWQRTSPLFQRNLKQCMWFPVGHSVRHILACLEVKL